MDSFFTDRRIRVRFEKAFIGYIISRYDIPQGFPFSPVLYILYLAELLK